MTNTVSHEIALIVGVLHELSCTSIVIALKQLCFIKITLMQNRSWNYICLPDILIKLLINTLASQNDNKNLLDRSAMQQECNV